jgi:hypothetical protein
MTSERRTVEGSLPDQVVDQGEYPNPNPDDELALQRAHFAERQRRYQEDRAAAAKEIGEVQEAVGQQYEQAQHKPEHQQFVAEQRQHQQVDPPSTRGGRQSTEKRHMQENTPFASGELPHVIPVTPERESENDVPNPRD